MAATMSLGGKLLELIETRSIDYIPHEERGGRASDQATVWFAGSAQLMSLATGAIGINLGLDLGWTLLALAVGTVIGTAPVAAHATQGPHLGLPQMVQSRPQFGRYGVLLVWLLALLIYWGYVVLGGNLLGLAGQSLGVGSSSGWAVGTCAVAVLVAIFGYRWLHTLQRLVTVILLVLLAVYLGGLVVTGHLAPSIFLPGPHVDIASFFMVVSAATGYQLTWALFVSDYSRYMPRDTSSTQIMAYTSTGLFFGLFSFMAVGALCAYMAPGRNFVEGLVTTGALVLPGLGQLLIIAGGAGLLGLMAMCVYGGSLTIIAALDSIRPVRPTRGLRILTVGAVGLSAAVAAATLPSDLLETQFSAILAVVGYLLAPWTAINLTDFFVVRRGHYSVPEIFRRDGVYGLWNWRGLAAYAVTFAVMVPFMNISSYTGYVTRALGGVDIAFYVGVPVGMVAYWLMCRGFDLRAEIETIERRHPSEQGRLSHPA